MRVLSVGRLFREIVNNKPSNFTGEIIDAVVPFSKQSRHLYRLLRFPYDAYLLKRARHGIAGINSARIAKILARVEDSSVGRQLVEDLNPSLLAQLCQERSA